MLEGKIVATSLKAWRTLVLGCKEENKEVRYDPLLGVQPCSLVAPSCPGRPQTAGRHYHEIPTMPASLTLS